MADKEMHANLAVGAVNDPVGPDDEATPLLPISQLPSPSQDAEDSDVNTYGDCLAWYAMALMAVSHDFVPIQTVSRRDGPFFFPLLGLLLILNLVYAELCRRAHGSQGARSGLVPPSHWMLPYAGEGMLSMPVMIERPLQMVFCMSLILMPLYGSLVYDVINDLLGDSQSTANREAAYWMVLGIFGGAQCLMGLQAWRASWGMGVVRRFFHEHAKLYGAYDDRRAQWLGAVVGMLMGTAMVGAAIYYLNQRVLALLFSHGKSGNPLCITGSSTQLMRQLSLPWAVLMAVSVHMLAVPSLRRLLLQEVGFQLNRMAPRFLMMALVHGAVHAYAVFIMLNADFGRVAHACGQSNESKWLTDPHTPVDLAWIMISAVFVACYTLGYWMPLTWCRPLAMSMDGEPSACDSFASLNRGRRDGLGGVHDAVDRLPSLEEGSAQHGLFGSAAHSGREGVIDTSYMDDEDSNESRSPSRMSERSIGDLSTTSNRSAVTPL